MSNYNKILSQFTKLGHNESTTFTQVQLKRALDEICNRNAKLPQFNSQVAEQLWSQTQRNGDGTVTLKNFINIILKAHNLLKTNIEKCDKQLGQSNPDQNRKIQLQESLVQYSEDLKLLTIPFQISSQQESRNFRDSKYSVDKSRASQNQNGLEASGFFSGRASGIFSDVPSQRQNSTTLKLTFLITVILFMLQLIIMFHKNHFYNALVYISIFAIVILGYFDKYYMRFILFNLVLSIGFDFLWIILQASPFWNPYPPTHHSTIQTPFLRFMYFFVIILMLFKVLLVLLFFRYRNNDETVRKSVTIFSTPFEINGKIKQNNLISRYLSGQSIFKSSIADN